jgi:hypothetical protein
MENLEQENKYLKELVKMYSEQNIQLMERINELTLKILD